MGDDLGLQKLMARLAGDVMPLCVRSAGFAVADISSSSYLTLAPSAHSALPFIQIGLKGQEGVGAVT